MYLKAIEGPAGKLHGADLLVKGEVLHIDEAGRLEDGGAEPRDAAVRRDDHVRAQDALAK